MAAGTLENVVEFDNDSRLVVGSTIALSAEDASGRRFDFAFDSCALVWRGVSVSVKINQCSAPAQVLIFILLAAPMSCESASRPHARVPGLFNSTF